MLGRKDYYSTTVVLNRRVAVHKVQQHHLKLTVQYITCTSYRCVIQLRLSTDDLSFNILWGAYWLLRSPPGWNSECSSNFDSFMFVMLRPVVRDMPSCNVQFILWSDCDTPIAHAHDRDHTGDDPYLAEIFKHTVPISKQRLTISMTCNRPSLAPFLPLATWRASDRIDDGSKVRVPLHLFFPLPSSFHLCPSLRRGLREHRCGSKSQVQRTTHDLPPDRIIEQSIDFVRSSVPLPLLTLPRWGGYLRPFFAIIVPVVGRGRGC